MKKENWDIIAKHLTDETLSKEELAYIDEAQSNEELKKLIEESASALKDVNWFYELNKFNTDNAWNKINNQVGKSNKIFFMPKRLLQIAAVLIFLIATSVIIWQKMGSNNYIKFDTAQTDISQPQITLPDGTNVILNHGSEITYPKKFKGHNRMVSLQGEAFFDVTPNKEMPFIIRTEKAVVKVLGTSFNVYAYENKNTVEVTVKTGRVELINDISKTEGSEKIMLLPGDKGTFNKTTGLLDKLSAKNLNSFSWITHEIVFELATLKEVISTLENIYSISFDMEKQVDLEQIITASFNKQNPDYILDVVALTLSLEIINTGENAYFIKNK